MRAAGSRTDSPAPLGMRRFLGCRVLTLVPLFFITFLVAFWLGWLLILAGAWSPEGGFPKIDFFSYWAGSSLALRGEAAAAYDAETIWREQLQLPGDDSGYFAWLYPPTFFFFVLPLSLLPVAASLAAWVAATGALLLSAVHKISKDRTVLMLALAFPAVIWNFVIGQNGFLTAGLLAWGVLLLRDRPVIAGALLGLIAYKPQFFPLILVALLAARERTAAISALSCIAALCLASLAAFGLGAWENFFSWALSSGNSIYSSGLEIQKMQSVSALLLVAGASPLLTQAIQGAATLATAAFVFWLWRRDVALEYKGAGLALAILLASPYSYHYDLTLLGLAALWLGVRFQKEGWRLADAEVLVLAWLSPLLTVVVASQVGITIGPLVVVMMLAMVYRRVYWPAATTASAPERQTTASATA